MAGGGRPDDAGGNGPPDGASGGGSDGSSAGASGGSSDGASDGSSGSQPAGGEAAVAGLGTVAEAADLTEAFDRLEQLLTFPADFPLKVMGRRVDLFAQTVVGIVRAHVPSFDPAGAELRPSSKGTWLSVTVVPRIESRAQLEALYRELSTHPLVKVVL